MSKQRLIIKGSQLNGSAMPGILTKFRAAVIGRTIVDAGYLIMGTPEGEEEDYEDETAWPCLVLDNGETVIIQRDDEGNGPGTPVLNNGNRLCRTSLK